MAAPLKPKITPLMEQYWSVKNDHPDKIILFRMGDFFEMFHDDAVTAAPILNIALTQRNKKSNDNTPMCGVPHHSIPGPIGKLLAAGLKVAICDQVEDPKLAKGLVKRAVTRVLTPGMVYDPESLNELEANYLCAFHDSSLVDSGADSGSKTQSRSSVSFLDVSTGEAFYYILNSPEEIKKYIQLLKPIEIVFQNEKQKREWPQSLLNTVHLTVFGKSNHDNNNNINDGRVKSEGASYEEGSLESRANSENVEIQSTTQNLSVCAQLLLNYCVNMQGDGILKSLRPFEKRSSDQVMNLSERVLSHLEVFQTYKGELKGSLFYAINRTKTSAGARRFKQWLQFPLLKAEDIMERQNKVAFWCEDMARLKMMRQLFSSLGDIERRLSKINLPTCHPRDLQSLSASLKTGFRICELNSNEKLNYEGLKELVHLIDRAICEELSGQLKNGGFIKKEYNSQLDEYITLSDESQKLLMDMEAQEKQKTQISTLKIRYNNVFGYYIEITHAHKNKVPDHYKRKQTLTNAERYVTQELHELESKILSARSKRVDLENELFASIKKEIQTHALDILSMAHVWSDWDVCSSLAWLSLEQNYVVPTFSEQRNLNLLSSRHPVVEQEVNQDFIANDIQLEKGQCFLLTGPNMAGKSTLMRQVAVTALMAQVGSSVPAQIADVPIFENIFTRIGASDHLSEGLSTFMVEMVETAELLKNSDPKTLIILDEIGRGTSTYDGMSLAQAILEFIITDKKSMTFFATHYHELTQLSEKYKALQNVHMSIQENKNSGALSFLYSLKNGPANKSYGIQVAQLAGLPISIVKHAQSLLKGIEKNSPDMSSHEQLNLLEMAMPITMEVTEDEDVKAEIKQLVEQVKNTSVQKMTPLDALNQISKWQQDLS